MNKVHWLGDVYFEMGWVEEARSILNEGLRKFPGDEVIEIMLKRIEDETDNPDNGEGVSMAFSVSV